MEKTTADLVREIEELRNEMNQMREVLSMLFNLVVDSDDDEDDGCEYPGFIQDNPKFNT